MAKVSYLKITLSILLATTIILVFTSYSLWKKNDAMIRDDYGRYVKSQYNLRDLLFNSLKAKDNRIKFIDSLALVKGEFISTTHIFEQVKVPEELKSFHQRGLYICNQAFSEAIVGKRFDSNIGELQEYMEELDRLLLKLNYPQVIDSKTPENIYQTLEDISNKMERE